MAAAKSTASRKQSPATITSLEGVSVPEWFHNAAEELSPARRRWLKALPPILLRGNASSLEAELPDLARPWLISALVYSEKEGARHDLVDLVKRHAAPASLDAWMKTLLAAWKEGREDVAGKVIANAAPSSPPVAKEKPSAKAEETSWADRDWVLTAAGYLGGDETALYLQAAAREWAKDKKSALSLRAVDVLGRIGSKLAMEQVSTLSAVMSSRVVADAALRIVETKATDRGMTRGQIEDTLAPTCGFEQNGERIFVYGPVTPDQPESAPRTFRAQIRKDLTLALSDAEGRPLKSMPKPGKSDHEQTATASRAAWSDLKTSFKRVIRSQTKRFEQAMITGRSWSGEAFQTHILRHPIVSRFAQTLIWQIRADSETAPADAESHPAPLARLTEDLTFADRLEERVSVRPTDRIHVAHPLSFAAPDLQAWGEILSDYRIVQPFPQVSRPVYRAAREGKDRFCLIPPQHPAIKPGVLYGVLDNDGWRLGESNRERTTRWSWKSFVGEQTTALLFYTGLVLGISQSPDQLVEKIEFYRGTMDSAARPVRPNTKPLPLAEVPPIAYSEAMRRLVRLTSSIDMPEQETP